MRGLGFLFTVSGRFTRLQFWLVQGALILSGISLLGLMRMVADPDTGVDTHHVSYGIFVVYHLMAWINTCSFVKRYYDLGKPWYWMLMIFIPVVGPIFFIAETGFRRGLNQPNRFGSTSVATSS